MCHQFLAFCFHDPSDKYWIKLATQNESAYTTEKEKAFKAMADTLKFDDNEVVGILHVDW